MPRSFTLHFSVLPAVPHTATISWDVLQEAALMGRWRGVAHSFNGVYTRFGADHHLAGVTRRPFSTHRSEIAMFVNTSATLKETHYGSQTNLYTILKVVDCNTNRWREHSLFAAVGVTAGSRNGDAVWVWGRQTSRKDANAALIPFTALAPDTWRGIPFLPIHTLHPKLVHAMIHGASQTFLHDVRDWKYLNL